jgi:hypothetical protein
MEGSRLELTITGIGGGDFRMKCKRGQKKTKKGEIF